MTDAAVVVAMYPDPEGPPCDFCTTRPIVIQYGCKPFELPELLYRSSDLWWGACAACSRYIDARDRTHLWQHSLLIQARESPSLLTSYVPRSLLMLIQDGFWRHRTEVTKPVRG